MFVKTGVWPTTLFDGRSHMIGGLGSGFARNGILFAEDSVPECIQEGA